MDKIETATWTVWKKIKTMMSVINVSVALNSRKRVFKTPDRLFNFSKFYCKKANAFGIRQSLFKNFLFHFNMNKLLHHFLYLVDFILLCKLIFYGIMNSSLILGLSESVFIQYIVVDNVDVNLVFVQLTIELSYNHWNKIIYKIYSFKLFLQ